jgi:hypothetical protein
VEEHVRTRGSLPRSVEDLLSRVLTSPAARSRGELRRAVFDHVAALTRDAPSPPQIPPDIETYIRKVALHAHKVLDREVEAVRAAGYSVDEVFEITVAAAVSAGVTRMEIALAALEEVRDAAAS